MTDPLTPEELREETHVLDTFPGALALCRKCHKPWPCPTVSAWSASMVANRRVERLMQINVELRDKLDTLRAHHDKLHSICLYQPSEGQG